MWYNNSENSNNFVAQVNWYIGRSTEMNEQMKIMLISA
jgi:hypothetical protein